LNSFCSFTQPSGFSLTNRGRRVPYPPSGRYPRKVPRNARKTAPDLLPRTRKGLSRASDAHPCRTPRPFGPGFRKHSSERQTAITRVHPTNRHASSRRLRFIQQKPRRGEPPSKVPADAAWPPPSQTVMPVDVPWQPPQAGKPLHDVPQKKNQRTVGRKRIRRLERQRLARGALFI